MYVELHARSAFSFLEGASIPEELITRAAELGYTIKLLGIIKQLENAQPAKCRCCRACCS